MITFTTETIGGFVSAHPIFDDGKFAGLIEGPASSGRKTWRAILRGTRIGDFKTAELAKEAVVAAA